MSDAAEKVEEVKSDVAPHSLDSNSTTPTHSSQSGSEGESDADENAADNGEAGENGEVPVKKKRTRRGKRGGRKKRLQELLLQQQLLLRDSLRQQQLFMNSTAMGALSAGLPLNPPAAHPTSGPMSHLNMMPSRLGGRTVPPSPYCMPPSGPGMMGRGAGAPYLPPSNPYAMLGSPGMYSPYLSPQAQAQQALQLQLDALRLQQAQAQAQAALQLQAMGLGGFQDPSGANSLLPALAMLGLGNVNPLQPGPLPTQGSGDAEGPLAAAARATSASVPGSSPPLPSSDAFKAMSALKPGPSGTVSAPELGSLQLPPGYGLDLAQGNPGSPNGLPNNTAAPGIYSNSPFSSQGFQIDASVGQQALAPSVLSPHTPSASDAYFEQLHLLQQLHEVLQEQGRA